MFAKKIPLLQFEIAYIDDTKGGGGVRETSFLVKKNLLFHFYFFKDIIIKEILWRVSNDFDSGYAGHKLGQNYLQMLSVDDRSKKEGTNQEFIQSSTTPDPGYQWGK